MIVHLFDDYSWEDMLPLTHTIPMAELRCGIFTATERASKLWKEAEVSYCTQDYLQEKYAKVEGEDNLYLNAKWIINKGLAQSITELKGGEGYKYQDEILVFKTEEKFSDLEAVTKGVKWKSLTEEPLLLRKPWDIFLLNEEVLQSDWQWMYKSKAHILSSSNTIIGNPENIYIEEGAVVEGCIFQPMEGNVYISSSAEIMPGTVIRGSLAMLPHSQLKLSSKIYGATTLGPYCKVGGEVNNSVFTGYSNKGHDGFLGNSVVGSWCNFGADSNNSNLKNNYEPVKVWSEKENTFVKTGQQFCGLIMGDHSKCGINTMFNTGTVVGVSCNLFGSGFPRNFVPSFSWGGAQGYSEYKLEKALATMRLVMQRRDIELTSEDEAIMKHIFIQTQNQRNYK